MRTLISIAGAGALALTLTACGDTDDDAKADGCTPASSLTVHATDDLQFDADAYEAGAGCVEITYANDGSVAHTLLVEDEPGFKLSMGSEDKGTITLDAGTYTIYCDIPGHRSAGMEATLEVA
jgi:plastocyanin